MTKGDIIRTPTGRIALYEGGSINGAVFVYLDAQGKPIRHGGALDTFCIASTRLLAKLQPEGRRV